MTSSTACVKQWSFSLEKDLHPAVESSIISLHVCVCVHTCMSRQLAEFHHFFFFFFLAKIHHISIKSEQNTMRLSQNILFLGRLYLYQHSLRNQSTINHYETFSFILTPKKNWKEKHFWMGTESRLQEYLFLPQGYPKCCIKQDSGSLPLTLLYAFVLSFRDTATVVWFYYIQILHSGISKKERLWSPAKLLARTSQHLQGCSLSENKQTKKNYCNNFRHLSFQLKNVAKSNSIYIP